MVVADVVKDANDPARLRCCRWWGCRLLFHRDVRYTHVARRSGGDSAGAIYGFALTVTSCDQRSGDRP